MGISDIPPCKPYDILCNLARNAARAGAYNEWAQKNLVQVTSPFFFAFLARTHITNSTLPAFTLYHRKAQYYRDPAQLARYLESNHFLTSINNELSRKNATYATHLKQLDALVLVLFEQDRTVVPKESAWFGSYPPEEEEDDAPSAVFDLEFREERGEKAIVPMREQPLYVEDWIGLRALDEGGRVIHVSCEGEHMQLSTDCWRPLVEKYVGSRS